MRIAIGLVAASMAGGTLTAHPAYADTCVVKLVNGSAGSSSTCTVQATGFALAVTTGSVYVVITCDGRSYFSGLVGITEVHGAPGPCVLAITVTTNIGPANVVGATF